MWVSAGAAIAGPALRVAPEEDSATVRVAVRAMLKTYGREKGAQAVHALADHLASWIDDDA